MSEFKQDDQVDITIKATGRIDFEGDVQYRLGGQTHYLYKDGLADKGVTVTKRARPFGPGDVVEHNEHGYTYTLSEDAYFDHTTSLCSGSESLTTDFPESDFTRVFPVDA